MSDQAAQQAAEPTPCSPCRGTGSVISNLGGGSTVVACPWCDGSGTFISQHDAPARWAAAPVA